MSAPVDTLPNIAGAAMLLVGLLLPVRRRVDGAARLVAWQGGLLALAAASAASGGAGRHLWLLAAGAVAGRALLLPASMRAATKGKASRVRPPDAGRPVLGAGASLLVGGGSAVLAAAAVLPAGSGLDAATREGLALALAVLLAGLLAILVRRDVPNALLGLVAAENGALLGLVHAGDGMPGAAALAVLSPGLVACAVLAGLRAGRDGGLPWPVPGVFRR